jgi:hypothetical protein
MVAVEASKVRPGDELFNPRERDPYQWSRIRSVTEHTTEEGRVYTVITTWGGVSTWKHPREGVTIRQQTGA